jgi:hypothetical protein
MCISHSGSCTLHAGGHGAFRHGSSRVSRRDGRGLSSAPHRQALADRRASASLATCLPRCRRDDGCVGLPSAGAGAMTARRSGQQVEDESPEPEGYEGGRGSQQVGEGNAREPRACHLLRSRSQKKRRPRPATNAPRRWCPGDASPGTPGSREVRHEWRDGGPHGRQAPRTRPTTLPMIRNSCSPGCTTIGGRVGCSGFRTTAWPSRVKRFTVASPSTSATTISPG